jgi:hypothetical protein
MTDEREEDLLERLAALPTTDLEPGARESLRRQAHRALGREHALARRPVERRIRRLYHRAFEPAILAAVALAYLSWAVLEVQSILHP